MFVVEVGQKSGRFVEILFPPIKIKVMEVDGLWFRTQNIDLPLSLNEDGKCQADDEEDNSEFGHRNAMKRRIVVGNGGKLRASKTALKVLKPNQRKPLGCRVYRFQNSSTMLAHIAKKKNSGRCPQRVSACQRLNIL